MLDAFTFIKFLPNFFLKILSTSFDSFNLSIPWSIKIQNKLFFIALCNKKDVTVESTPPDKPQITLVFFKSSLKLLILSLRKFSNLNLFFILQILKRKFDNIFLPSNE